MIERTFLACLSCLLGIGIGYQMHAEKATAPAPIVVTAPLKQGVKPHSRAWRSDYHCYECGRGLQPSEATFHAETCFCDHCYDEMMGFDDGTIYSRN